MGKKYAQGLIENHRYRFRVRAVNKEGKSDPLETSGVYEAKNPFEVPSKPGRPKVRRNVFKSVNTTITITEVNSTSLPRNSFSNSCC